MKNPLADELTSYLLTPEGRTLPAGPRGTLSGMVYKHQRVTTLKEKAVDVMLAIDMLRLALEDEYDAAYLLSADGDFTPPIEAARSRGKKVYGASPNALHSSALQRVCTAYIPLRPDWFNDCYR